MRLRPPSSPFYPWHLADEPLRRQPGRVPAVLVFAIPHEELETCFPPQKGAGTCCVTLPGDREDHSVDSDALAWRVTDLPRHGAACWRLTGPFLWWSCDLGWACSLEEGSVLSV